MSKHKSKIVITVLIVFILITGAGYWYCSNNKTKEVPKPVENTNITKEIESKGLTVKELEHVSNQAYTDLVNESGGRIPDNKSVRSERFMKVQEYIKNKIKDEYLETITIGKEQLESKVKELKSVKENKNIDDKLLTSLAENAIKTKYLNEYSSQLTEDFLNDEESKEKK